MGFEPGTYCILDQRPNHWASDNCSASQMLHSYPTKYYMRTKPNPNLDPNPSAPTDPNPTSPTDPEASAPML